MTMEACFEVLELSGPVGRLELVRAYKRMVLKLHPDRCGDTPDARDAFRRVNEAYQRLKLLVESGPNAQAGGARPFQVGPCGTCGRLDRLSPGIQGRPACAECLLRKRRFLPLPDYRIIRGAAVIALQLAAVAGATCGLVWNQPSVALAAAGCALMSFAVLFLLLRDVQRFER